MATIREIKRVCDKKTRKPCIYRRICYYLAKPVLALNLTPNSLTFTWVILALIGTFFFIPGNYLYSLIGMGIIEFAFLFDHLDGMVARFRKIKDGSLGLYIDWVGSWLIFIAIFFFISIGLYFKYDALWPFILGFITIVGFIMGELTRLYEQAHSEKTKHGEFKKDTSHHKTKLYKIYTLFRQIFLLELDYFFYLLVIITIINRLEFLLLFYAVGFNILWVGKVIFEIVKYYKKPKSERQSFHWKPPAESA